MGRVFKSRAFARWARKSGLADDVLCRAVDEMESGLFDADLGGGVLKKRIPLQGRGKRGGARTLVATNKDDRWFFIVGFGKNERSNIANDELEALQALAADLLRLSERQLERAVLDGTVQEIRK